MSPRAAPLEMREDPLVLSLLKGEWVRSGSARPFVVRGAHYERSVGPADERRVLP